MPAGRALVFRRPFGMFGHGVRLNAAIESFGHLIFFSIPIPSFFIVQGRGHMLRSSQPPPWNNLSGDLFGDPGPSSGRDSGREPLKRHERMCQGCGFRMLPPVGNPHAFNCLARPGVLFRADREPGKTVIFRAKQL